MGGLGAFTTAVFNRTGSLALNVRFGWELASNCIAMRFKEANVSMFFPDDDCRVSILCLSE